MSHSPPQLLALDWGTTSLRAFLMRGSQVLETRQSGHGIQHLPAPGSAGFEQAFAAIAGDWVRQWPSVPIVASGMVGSAQGWREAPYVPCPADLSGLARSLVRVPTGLGTDIAIAPGVLLDKPDLLPDVMRGEEIQIAGALAENQQWAPNACFVLPGTHSKWIRVEDGKLIHFSTYMTGELYAVLRQHSILGRLIPESSELCRVPDREGFEMGLAESQRSRPGDLTHQIFATRTLGLSGRLPHAALADYLSGLLIGSELRSGMARANDAAGTPLVMIGEPALCRRYAQAFSYFGQPVATVLENTAPVGLWNFAVAAGLIENLPHGDQET